MSQPWRTDRRDFLKAAVAAWTVLPAVFRDDPYRPLDRRLRAPAEPVRVRGRVGAGRRGLPGVAMSDGRNVTRTDADGRFELVTDGSRPYVTLSVPRGYELPTGPSGTTRCYQRIQPDRRGEAIAGFELVPLSQPDDHHRFLLAADIQTQDAEDLAFFRRTAVPDLAATIAGLRSEPLFAVADGDIMWNHLELYDDYERAVTELGIPFVQVVGNHDLDLEATSDLDSTRTFERRFGARYYSFNRGEVHYVVLDDVFYYGGGYLGYLTDEQLVWLANDLALVERGGPVVVFLHIPLWCSLSERMGQSQTPIANVVTNREALYRLLEPYDAHVLSGHIHESDLVRQGGVKERNHGTVCGAWWTGNICYDGTPNGYGIYEVKGREIRWQYKSTDHPLEHQMRVYPRGTDPAAPDEIVANIWAWEPDWTVTWYEAGVRRGLMSQRIGLDPQAVAQQTGPNLPAKRGWIDPVRTRHLFYAPVAPDAKDVRVEATDVSGRTYSGVVSRNWE